MTIEELLNTARASFTPSEEDVKAKAKELVASELVSKLDRVTALENELNTAKASLAETEAVIAALEPAPVVEEAPVEAPDEEVQG